MILGNLIIAFSPLHFFYLGITLTIIGTGFFKIFLQWLGSFIKWGTVVEMLVLDCFIPELILSIVRGAVCVYLEQVQTTVGVMLLSAAIVMVIGLITFNNETFLGP
jgi:POT family proton-dependent oligopeptide transporter